MFCRANSGVTAVGWGCGHSASLTLPSLKINLLGKTRGSEKEKKKGEGKKGRRERKGGKGREKEGGTKNQRKEGNQRRKGRKCEDRFFFPKYQVIKINQNYTKAVYKWVKSDEFLRG